MPTRCTAKRFRLLGGCACTFARPREVKDGPVMWTRQPCIEPFVQLTRRAERWNAVVFDGRKNRRANENLAARIRRRSSLSHACERLARRAGAPAVRRSCECACRPSWCETSASPRVGGHALGSDVYRSSSCKHVASERLKRFRRVRDRGEVKRRKSRRHRYTRAERDHPALRRQSARRSPTGSAPGEWRLPPNQGPARFMAPESICRSRCAGQFGSWRVGRS